MIRKCFFAWLLICPSLVLGLSLFWESGAGNPHGTHYEVVVNGGTVKNITGTSIPIDAYVEGPGSTINAQVRAIPPAGATCGDPPVECLPSQWAQLSTVVPGEPIAIAPKIPIDLQLAITEAPQTMAITTIGTETLAGTSARRSAGNKTASIDIPAGANYAIITFGGYVGRDPLTFDPVSLNGNSATLIDGVLNINNQGYRVSMFGVPLLAGDAGTGRTLAWTVSRNIQTNEGGSVIVRYLSGVDTASPVRATDTDANETTSVSASVSAQDGDYIAVLGMTYTDDGPLNWNTVTDVVVEVTEARHHYAEAFATSAGSFSVSGTSGSWPGLVVASIIPDSGATPTTETETLSIDALVQDSGLLSSVGVDSLLQSVQSEAVSLSSVIAAVQSGNATLDGLLQVASQAELSLDALAQALINEQLSTDALIRASGLSQAQLDAVLIEIIAGLAETNLGGLLQASDLTQSQIDAVLIAVSEGAVSVNIGAMLQNAFTATASVDSVLAGLAQSSASLSGLLEAFFDSAVSVDALLETVDSATVSADAILKGVKAGSISLDAVIVSQGTAISSVGLGALVQDVLSRELSFDAVIAQPGGSTVGLNALLAAASLAGVSADAIIIGATSSDAGLDAALSVAGVASVPLDAVIGAIQSNMLSVDAILVGSNFSVADFDAYLKGQLVAGLGLDAIVGDIGAIPLTSGRVAIVAPDGRFVIVGAEDRTVIVGAEDRTVILN